LARGAMGYSENATIYGNDTTAEPGFKEAALRNHLTTLTVAAPESFMGVAAGSQVRLRAVGTFGCAPLFEVI
jgi:hypothetical protein